LAAAAFNGVAAKPALIALVKQAVSNGAVVLNFDCHKQFDHLLSVSFADCGVELIEDACGEEALVQRHSRVIAICHATHLAARRFVRYRAMP
jgi:hypothetical protein